MKIVFITGAGISVDSGISSYRGVGSVPARKTLSTISRITDKDGLKAYFNEFKELARSCRPNAIHLAIAEFDKHFDVTVITQNIDDLHEKAGSKNVIHAHGSVFHGDGDIPDVVLFGEDIKQKPEIEKAIASCEMLVYVGTSGAVYPINSYVDLCSAKKVEINVDSTFISDRFDTCMHGDTREMLDKLLRQIKEN
jgi:NAD-dependent deacetylase